MSKIDIQAVKKTLASIGTQAKTAAPTVERVAGTVKDVAKTDEGADFLEQIERGMRDRALQRLQHDNRFEKVTGIAVKASRLADTATALASVGGVARAAVERNFATDRGSRSL